VKICWDNLNKLRYNNKTNIFRYKNSRHGYKESENICLTCGEYFLARNLKNLYCSKECRNKSNELKNKTKEVHTGRTVSAETRKKISKLHKGKKLNEETKKKLSEFVKNNQNGENAPSWKGGYFKRNEVSYDQKAYLVDFCHEIRRSPDKQDVLEVRCAYCNRWYKPTWLEISNRIKAIHYIGNGGRNLYCSKECKLNCPTYNQPYFPKGFKPTTPREVQPELRKLVFERDNWSCVKCGIGENLHCHHIDPVINNPIESADIDNCITLCRKCHKEVHRQIGCTYKELRCW